MVKQLLGFAVFVTLGEVRLGFIALVSQIARLSAKRSGFAAWRVRIPRARQPSQGNVFDYLPCDETFVTGAEIVIESGWVQTEAPLVMSRRCMAILRLPRSTSTCK